MVKSVDATGGLTDIWQISTNNRGIFSKVKKTWSEKNT